MIDFGKMEKYAIKWGAEIGWVVVVSVGAFALDFIQQHPVDATTDWKVYVVSLGAGCGRVAWAVAKNILISMFSGQPPVAPSP